jgi:hypothetical protein
MSLPIAEAEKERAFLIRKFVVGDLGVRMKKKRSDHRTGSKSHQDEEQHELKSVE